MIAFPRTALIALGWLLFATAVSFALDPAPSLDGAVRQPLVLDEATLRALPVTEVDISFETGKGKETGRYTGALLWTLVGKAQPIDAEGKNASLRHTLLIRGRDGYAVSIAIGEIDPHYEGKPVILAYGGGEPPASFQSLRLIIPGDLHGGRAVRDVARVEVK